MVALVKKLRNSVLISSFNSEGHTPKKRFSNNEFGGKHRFDHRFSTFESREQWISQKDIDGLKSGKFRQTRSFVIIGRLFKYGVPRTVHTKMLKSYKDSFTGREATLFLMTNIVPRVYDPKPGTDYRSISISLLSYFLREGFIIEVGKNSKEENFKDSTSKLYCINENYTFPEIPYDFNPTESCRFEQSTFSTKRGVFYNNTRQRMISLSQDSGFNSSLPMESPELSPNTTNVIENLIPEYISLSTENKSDDNTIPEEIELSPSTPVNRNSRFSKSDFSSTSFNTITYPSTSYSNLVVINSDSKVFETIHSNRSRTSVILYTDQDNFEIFYDSDTASDSGEREIFAECGPNGHALTHEMIYGVALRGFLREIVGSEVRRKLLKQLNYSCSDLKRNLENVNVNQIVYVEPENDVIPRILSSISAVTESSDNGKVVEDMSEYDNLLHMIEADQLDHFEGRPYLPDDFTKLILKMAFFYKSDNKKIRMTLKYSKQNGRNILKEFKPLSNEFLASIPEDFDWKNERNIFVFEKDTSRTLGSGLLTYDIEEEDSAEFLDLISSLLLLLPSYIRRRIQLFVKYMVEVEENSSFQIKEDVPNRYFLLRDFSNILVDSTSMTVSVWITTFFLDNFSKIFTFPPKIQATVSALHKTSPPRPTKKLHEDGKLCTDHECYRCFQYVNKQLRTQLTYIITNPNLTNTVRKKELETFKSRYPYIYYEMFPKNTTKLSKRLYSAVKSIFSK
ncbi:DEP domain and Winged helix-turn-helix DNA-binding domain-containing protein [Strongyloides ratti]|uniref:DEP domain and Winged helix-turn-helix DNA-binding domain-containing protein n=1 Tax=Strongyloides ratti TaxID=34506 RepID=A0A090LC72_STRRB|nr:DEP domain and Winged helix-turn-helix DNA-binding domain-containing protein [Strongyloides ratti]CEF67372.1 DEP domain and Winged helix-turn-helix DNA-binding domain-containing protein [Strongyloides ratti]